ncbi:hypothetical protein [Caulobacter sp. DWP3-1-3b2]|uniref:hypothetical protein n=1 Tax=Caulobacter sp. DWP3-1-3b2 TaxID=2804643 RepID=UPI003CF256CF
MRWLALVGIGLFAPLAGAACYLAAMVVVESVSASGHPPGLNWWTAAAVCAAVTALYLRAIAETVSLLTPHTSRKLKIAAAGAVSLLCLLTAMPGALIMNAIATGS